LERVTLSDDWHHRDQLLPAAQIVLARRIVTLLRSVGIEARLGGSVAALGYSSSRVPDDVDIDIKPKGAHIKEGKVELDGATKLICERLEREFSIGVIAGYWCDCRINGFTLDQSSSHVVALQVHCVVSRLPPSDRPDIGGDDVPLPIKLQLINETAFTFMNKTLDPGQVSVEKYKEVAGFSRLVANGIGRYLQAPGGPKNDRERVRQMLVAKLRSADPQKVVAVCAKILSYFALEGDEAAKSRNDRRQAAGLLDELVSGFRQDFPRNQLFSQLVHLLPLPTEAELSQTLQQLIQAGLLNSLSLTKQ
jgi:hypothetical protein